MLNFPNNPELNDTHTVGDITYRWNGVAWKSVGSGAGGGCSVYQRGAAWIRSGAPIEVPSNDVISLRIPTNSVITQITVLGIAPGSPAIGSCVVDIWRQPFEDFPPTVINSICSTNKPTLSAEIGFTDSVLTGWTTSLNEGDVLIFHLESSSDFEAIYITLDLVCV